MTDALSDLSALARADPIRSTLRAQTLRPTRRAHAEFTHLILIEAGQATLRLPREEHLVDAGSAMILPPVTEAELTIGAGSRGWLLGGAPGFLAEAVGNNAESVLLQAMLGQLALVHCDGPAFAAAFQTLASLFHNEVTQPARGSQMAAAAYLRLIVIAFWRQGEFDVPTIRGRSTEARLIDEFRRQVEVNFRKQQPVVDYARQLGLSYDRLHAICDRSLRRSPLQLIHQRLLREAVQRLERSGESIQGIADQLGFSDPTQFSHFFKRRMALSPRDYRKRSRLSSRDWSGVDPESFADWP